MCPGLPCRPVSSVLIWKNKLEYSGSKTTEMKLWRLWTTDSSRNLGTKDHSNGRVVAGMNSNLWADERFGTGRSRALSKGQAAPGYVS